MNISYISIANFRGICRLERLEVGRLNTLVGKNDSGKSIILYALARFFDEKFDARDVYKGKLEGEEVFVELGFTPDLPVDDLATDRNGCVVIRKVFLPEAKKTKCATYYRTNDYTDGSHQDLWNKKETELNSLIDALGGDSKRSGRGNTNLQRIEVIKSLLPSAERAEVLHELKDFLTNLGKAYFVALPEFSIFQADSDLDIDATSFQSQFRPLISRSIEGQSSKTSELERAVESDLSAEFNEIRKLMARNVSGLTELKPKLQCDWSKAFKFDLDLRLDGEASGVPMSHKGTGFRRLLMVAYFEYLATRKGIENYVFAIEEPETFLHPAAQEDLLRSFMELSSRSQFFLTTHSPVFAGASDCAFSVLVSKDGTGASIYTRGDGVRDQIIDELGVRPDYNLLKNANFLVFVEGPDDVQILRAATVALRGTDLETHGILCLFGGGSALRNYGDLDLFRKLSAGRGTKYAVLVDGDNGDVTKRNAINAIRERCASDGAIFHQLARREIENYCCPERIKQVYIDDIVQREGPASQNPRIAEIRSLNLQLSPTDDVEEVLASHRLTRFKGKANVAAFKRMDRTDWERVDQAGEIAAVLDAIYARVPTPAPIIPHS